MHIKGPHRLLPIEVLHVPPVLFFGRLLLAVSLLELTLLDLSFEIFGVGLPSLGLGPVVSGGSGHGEYPMIGFPLIRRTRKLGEISNIATAIA